MSSAIETLTTEEAAAALGVTPARVRQMIRAGQLPAARFGRSHVINRNDLSLVEDRPVGRPPNKQTPSIVNRATAKPRASNGSSTSKRAKKR